jgi:predicted DNA-binding WGR domain protein
VAYRSSGNPPSSFTASTPRNIRRFHRFGVLPDLFEAVLLMKQWVRSGSRGQCQTRRFEDATTAYAALLAQAQRKERRGYGRLSACRVDPAIATI